MPKVNKNRKAQNQNRKGKGKNPGTRANNPNLRSEPLYEPNHPLAGKDLKQAAWELVKRQVRPTLKAANRELGQLNAQEKAVLDRTGQQAALGNASIKSYYDQLAAQETAFLNAQQGSQGAFQQFLSQNAQQTQDGLKQALSAAQGTFADSPTTQPIASQNRLTEMGQEYQDQAALNSQTQNKVAAENSKAFTDYSASMAGAAGARGGENLSAYNRQIANRISDIGEEFSQPRNKILGAKADLISGRPELFKSALEGLRRESRETYQANKALGIKEDEITQGTKSDNRDFKQKLQILKREETKRMAELDRLEASETKKAAEQQRFREKEMEWQDQYAANKNKGKGNEPGAWRTFPEANRYFQSLPGVNADALINGVTIKGTKLTAKQVYNKTLIKMTQNGISKSVAKKVLNRAIAKGKKKNKGSGWGSDGWWKN